MRFYYDFSSPYAYLAAHRIGTLLPAARWQPIAFGPLVVEIGKVPWSWEESADRTARMEDCERRAAALGLPLRWPPGWPRATYSIVVLRAALIAEERGRLREFSLAAFDAGLGHGRDLSDLAVVLEAAEAAGLSRAAVEAGVARPEVKARLRAVTDAAIARGVTGVPTVDVGGRLFWGDDRLEEAAAAAL
ncbi:DsbA family protein [Conexibacter stalactiti]|uniref:2-hydroxychromene-2-carboxylate isomerase n=1 Tax=Conexibacter stalactiti TaxID=1940611 RepID=A0ABU4HTS0_9ACTN|nr:DsbA family protein [Conexibacter stalactiti]MDW5596189.1 DsbA family protein [Conexibacter stalactiti]MEC5036831.1 DsbA family protein [Conexibacter stalactiti]